ncbi:MAG: BMC domain-containing protein [Deltaproteobacteria bacterium]|nr:BMC domain-containing protein [Deltaproteobacteria bacterium]
MRDGPAIGLVETASIARGMVVCDTMAKRAEVDILGAFTVSRGKFIILLAGEVAEVSEAMAAGLSCAAEELVDQLFLPQPHRRLLPAIRHVPSETEVEAVGIFETATIASNLLAADAALKAAEVDLLEVRLGNGIGGKAYFLLNGPLHELQAAMQAGLDSIEQARVIKTEVIARPHPDFVRAAIRSD